MQAKVNDTRSIQEISFVSSEESTKNIQISGLIEEEIKVNQGSMLNIDKWWNVIPGILSPNPSSSPPSKPSFGSTLNKDSPIEIKRFVTVTEETARENPIITCTSDNWDTI
jgi:hypothetical protein